MAAHQHHSLTPPTLEKSFAVELCEHIFAYLSVWDIFKCMSLKQGECRGDVESSLQEEELGGFTVPMLPASLQSLMERVSIVGILSLEMASASCTWALSQATCFLDYATFPAKCLAAKVYFVLATITTWACDLTAKLWALGPVGLTKLCMTQAYMCCGGGSSLFGGGGGAPGGGGGRPFEVDAAPSSAGRPSWSAGARRALLSAGASVSSLGALFDLGGGGGGGGEGGASPGGAAAAGAAGAGGGGGGGCGLAGPPPPVDDPVLRRARRISRTAALLGYREVARPRRGARALPPALRRRVSRMMHFRVSLNPFEAVVAAGDDGRSRTTTEDSAWAEDWDDDDAGGGGGGPFLRTPCSLPPTPLARARFMAHAAGAAEDTVYLARAQLRLEEEAGRARARRARLLQAQAQAQAAAAAPAGQQGGDAGGGATPPGPSAAGVGGVGGGGGGGGGGEEPATAERRALLEALRRAASSTEDRQQLAVWDPNPSARAEGVLLSKGLHIARRRGNAMHSTVRSVAPVPPNASVYFEVEVLSPEFDGERGTVQPNQQHRNTASSSSDEAAGPAPAGPPRDGGGSSFGGAAAAAVAAAAAGGGRGRTAGGVAVGLGTAALPPAALVGAWPASVALNGTGQVFLGARWYNCPGDFSFRAGDRIGVYVYVDEAQTVDCWEGEMTPVYTQFSVNGRAVPPTAEHHREGPLLVPRAAAGLFPAVTLQGEDAAVQCCFCAEDVIYPPHIDTFKQVLPWGKGLLNLEHFMTASQEKGACLESDECSSNEILPEEYLHSAVLFALDGSLISSPLRQLSLSQSFDVIAAQEDGGGLMMNTTV